MARDTNWVAFYTDHPEALAADVVRDDPRAWAYSPSHVALARLAAVIRVRVLARLAGFLLLGWGASREAPEDTWEE